MLRGEKRREEMNISLVSVSRLACSWETEMYNRTFRGSRDFCARAAPAPARILEVHRQAGTVETLTLVCILSFRKITIFVR